MSVPRLEIAYIGRLGLGRGESTIERGNAVSASAGGKTVRDRDFFLSFKGFDNTGHAAGSSFHEDQSATSLFWGEIYNASELLGMLDYRGLNQSPVSPSKVCCMLYKRFGHDFAKRINGMFSIVLWDKDAQTLFLITDRFGSPRPIYYSTGDKLAFSNKLIMLAKNGANKTEVCADALALFFKYGYIPAPMTAFEGIEKLNHGEMIICRQGRITKKRYHDFEVPEDVRSASSTMDALVESYLALLERSIHVKVNVNKDERVGCFLSGGLDSGACVALASKVKGGEIRAFGLGFEDISIDERPYARIVADEFGVPFYDYVFTGQEIEDLPRIIWAFEEPFQENGLFLTYGGFKSAHGRVDVVLAGDGNDQLYGTGGFAGARPVAVGYLLGKLRLHKCLEAISTLFRFEPFYKDSWLNKLKVMTDRCIDFNNWFFWGFDIYELQRLFKTPLTQERLKPFAGSIVSHGLDLPNYYKTATIMQDIEHYACQNVLVKSFRLAEMFGVTVREAYLDNMVVDFLGSLGLHAKRRGTLLDYLLARTKSKYLHRIAFTDILPSGILNKPKQGGFVPTSMMLNDRAKRRACFSYVERSGLVRDLLDIHYVKRLCLELDELFGKPITWQAHRDARANRFLYLLTAALWRDLVIERHGDGAPVEMLSDVVRG